MAIFAAFALIAAAGVSPAPAHVPTKAVAAASATVRILKPARVTLSAAIQPDGHRLHKSTVKVEDGSRRPALLVEFQ